MRYCLTIVLACSIWGCGSQDHSVAASSDKDGAAPKLVTGLGAVHLPVSTANADAQKYFDQGLAYVYAFNHAEAVKSFEQAAKLDPKLAMAHWGKGLALGPNINAAEMDQAAAKAAYEESQRATALAANASPK